MSSGLERLNSIPEVEARERLLGCCSSVEWARRLAAERPFASTEELARAADRIWRSLPEREWLDAFAAHPRIGTSKVAGTGPADLHPPQSMGTGVKGTDLFRHSARPSGAEGTPNKSVPNFALNKSVPNSADRWSREEQAGTKSASPETLANLADANREYEERFGHIFIVCATGRSAAEMLALLEARLHNDPQTELAIAAEEQRRIMQLRLAKLLEAEGV
ncbi:MAG TPA: 2-oxo-4-hydroxy-4-carboxy-5-ureidoimidazoline decarboxylase [Thermoanaerobaculia bacterium]|nr:2-oxo-4-hydroxy-4-carboxy-5-ureidoimidazoline decarboxylase [Thermoanaerobaculia bacterium]